MSHFKRFYLLNFHRQPEINSYGEVQQIGKLLFHFFLITHCIMKMCIGKAKTVQVRAGSEFSRILWQSAHESGKVVRPAHRSPLPTVNIPGTHFCGDRGSTVFKVLCYKL